MAPLLFVMGQVAPVQRGQGMALAAYLHQPLLLRRYNGQLVQRNSSSQHPAVLVVGVVAAKLCAARSRIDLHLPPRPIVKLKLLKGRIITAALAGQDLLAAAVKRGQRGVPPPCCDLFSELPAGWAV